MLKYLLFMMFLTPLGFMGKMWWAVQNFLFVTFFVNCFISSNLFMFYLFFEGSLIPTLFLIFGWGYQPERMQAGLYLLLYTLLASLPLLVGIIYLEGIRGSLIPPLVVGRIHSEGSQSVLHSFPPLLPQWTYVSEGKSVLSLSEEQWHNGIGSEWKREVVARIYSAMMILLCSMDRKMNKKMMNMNVMNASWIWLCKDWVIPDKSIEAGILWPATILQDSSVQNESETEKMKSTLAVDIFVLLS